MGAVGQVCHWVSLLQEVHTPWWSPCRKSFSGPRQSRASFVERKDGRPVVVPHGQPAPMASIHLHPSPSASQPPAGQVLLLFCCFAGAQGRGRLSPWLLSPSNKSQSRRHSHHPSLIAESVKSEKYYFGRERCWQTKSVCHTGAACLPFAGWRSLRTFSSARTPWLGGIFSDRQETKSNIFKNAFR